MAQARWGFGAVFFKNDVAESYFYGSWAPEDSKMIGYELGDPAGQTIWEYICLLLVLMVFGAENRGAGLAILGDNLASLELALTMKGKMMLGRVSRELSWRRIRFGWHYACGHLPAERNLCADALSRVSAPSANAKAVPPEVASARRRLVPRVAALWTSGL